MSGLYSFYRTGDGTFTGDTYVGSHVAAATPEGCAAIAGRFNPAAQCVDLQTGQVVAYEPPPPSPEVERERSLRRVQRAIDAAEARQARPVRELAAAAAASETPPAAAVQRLAEIEAQIQALRLTRAAIVAATTSEQLAGVAWPEQPA